MSLQRIASHHQYFYYVRKQRKYIQQPGLQERPEQLVEHQQELGDRADGARSRLIQSAVSVGAPQPCDSLIGNFWINSGLHHPS